MLGSDAARIQRLAKYLDGFATAFVRDAQADHAQRNVRGLLSDAKRKNMEGMLHRLADPGQYQYWCDDEDRRERNREPEDLVHCSKPVMAIDQIDVALAAGFEITCVLAQISAAAGFAHPLQLSDGALRAGQDCLLALGITGEAPASCSTACRYR